MTVHGPVRRRAPRTLLIALSWLLAGGGLFVQVPAQAQVEIYDPVQDLDFDDPEAWAMKFFTSVSLLTGLGPVADREAGDVTLGLEVLSVPHLDQEQRTVGFGGFKEEDLSRSPIWARIRAEIGLGAGWGVVVGWAPPLEVDGVKADLWSLALEKAVFSGDRWSLGLRAYGQTGKASGDLTCTEGGDERFPPGSVENPFGCEGPSSDEISMEYFGAELVASYDPASGATGSKRGAVPELHGGVSVNHLDMEFQVDAQTFGFLDRSLLRADGDTVGLTFGATWHTGERGRLGAELFYSPLDVRRAGDEVESDDLLNLRLLWRWQVR